MASGDSDVERCLGWLAVARRASGVWNREAVDFSMGALLVVAWSIEGFDHSMLYALRT